MYAHPCLAVQLKRDGKVIGFGKVVSHAKTVHGFQLTEGWVSVEVMQLHRSFVPCWKEYPTLSDEIEVGSYSAWPIDELEMLSSGSMEFLMFCLKESFVECKKRYNLSKTNACPCKCRLPKINITGMTNN